MRIIEIIVRQVLSGRWLLTLSIGYVFAYTSIKGILEASDVKMIIGMGMTFYFMKSQNGNDVEHMNGKTEVFDNLTTKDREIEMLKEVIEAKGKHNEHLVNELNDINVKSDKI